MQKTSKSWWQSKTIQINVLLFLGGVILLATDTFTMSSEVASGFLFVNSVINIALRTLTNTSIK